MNEEDKFKTKYPELDYLFYCIVPLAVDFDVFENKEIIEKYYLEYVDENKEWRNESKNKLFQEIESFLKLDPFPEELVEHATNLCNYEEVPTRKGWLEGFYKDLQECYKNLEEKEQK